MVKVETVKVYRSRCEGTMAKDGRIGSGKAGRSHRFSSARHAAQHAPDGRRRAHAAQPDTLDLRGMNVRQEAAREKIQPMRLFGWLST